MLVQLPQRGNNFLSIACQYWFLCPAKWIMVSIKIIDLLTRSSEILQLFGWFCTWYISTWLIRLGSFLNIITSSDFGSINIFIVKIKFLLLFTGWVYAFYLLQNVFWVLISEMRTCVSCYMWWNLIFLWNRYFKPVHSYKFVLKLYFTVVLKISKAVEYFSACLREQAVCLPLLSHGKFSTHNRNDLFQNGNQRDRTEKREWVRHQGHWRGLSPSRISIRFIICYAAESMSVSKS